MTAVTLLDGGMGQELIHRSGDKPTPLWATRVMLDHPGIVKAVHADYFSAGATIATTNTYSIHHDRLLGAGLDGEFATLLNTALDEAHAARNEHGSGRIAGAIGPLVASYQPETHPPYQEAVEKYAELARIIAPHVDLIICETVASLAHARAVLDGALKGEKPVWLAITVDDMDGTKLRSGEPVADICEIAAGRAQAVLANCSVPEAITAAMAPLSTCGLPFGGYANGFRKIAKEFLQGKPTVDALTAREDLTPETYAEFALCWVSLGATIVGGCCEVGPAHISELARCLRAANHRIV